MKSPLPLLPNSLFLFFALTILASSAFAQPTDVRFEDETISSGTYEATITVSARNATILSGSTVTFRAGQNVRLEAGFKAELGATFRAEVDVDVGSGNGGGPIVLDDVPPNERVGRFFADRFDIYRPALTLRGFDSAVLPSGTDYGYGLKQVIERIYDTSYEDHLLVRRVYEKIVQESKGVLVNPFSASAGQDRREAINKSSRITQSRAFVALATYVMEQNGNSNADYQIGLS